MRQLIRVQVPAWAPPVRVPDHHDRRRLRDGRYAARGRLAQLVRAPRLHRGSHWFESSTAHHEAANGPPRRTPRLAPRPCRSRRSRPRLLMLLGRATDRTQTILGNRRPDATPPVSAMVGGVLLLAPPAASLTRPTGAARSLRPLPFMPTSSAACGRSPAAALRGPAGASRPVGQSLVTRPRSDEEGSFRARRDDMGRSPRPCADARLGPAAAD